MSALNAALAEFQSKVTNPPRNRTVSAGQYDYSYATLDSICDMIRPLLKECSLAFTQRTEVTPQGTVLHTDILHTGGESIRSTMALPADKSMQQFGSALTYARRYSLCAILGIVAETDDDASQSEGLSQSEKRSGRKGATRAAPASQAAPRGEKGERVEAIRALHASMAAGGCSVPPSTTHKNWPGYTGWLKTMLEQVLGRDVPGLSGLPVEDINSARISIRRMLDNNELEPWKGIA